MHNYVNCPGWKELIHRVQNEHNDILSVELHVPYCLLLTPPGGYIFKKGAIIMVLKS